jgi:hypothetical protein
MPSDLPKHDCLACSVGNCDIEKTSCLCICHKGAKLSAACIARHEHVNDNNGYCLNCGDPVTDKLENSQPSFTELRGAPPVLPRNPHYLKLIEKIKSVHESKSHDYAKDTNVFSNFEFAAKVAEIFTDPVDKVFATLIGIKLARLAELRSGKKPKNEPLMDTLEDQTNYSAIWGSKIMTELEEKSE